MNEDEAAFGNYVGTKYDAVDNSYSPGKAFSMISGRNTKRANRKKMRFYNNKRKKRTETCPTCSTMVTKSNLKRHLLTHDILNQCGVCKMIYKGYERTRVHILSKHPEVNLAKNPGLCKTVKPSEVPAEELNAYYKRLEFGREKRGVYPLSTSNGLNNRVQILPSIRAFNCHDCLAAFPTVGSLFEHCKASHRTSGSGKPYRYLVPVKIKA